MQDHSLRCTFCRKTEHQVQKLVAGPGVYICDACVEIAHRIMSANGPPGRSEPSRWHRAATRIRAVLPRARRHLHLRVARLRHAL